MRVPSACLGLALSLSCLILVARAQQPVATRSLTSAEAGAILGRGVFDSANENVGLLVDVIVGKDGAPMAGVVDVGGFLGVGTRRVAVAWHLFRFDYDADGARIHMDLTFDAVAAAPESSGPDYTLIVIDRAPP